MEFASPLWSESRASRTGNLRDETDLRRRRFGLLIARGSTRPSMPAAKRIQDRLRDWWINRQINRGNSPNADGGGRRKGGGGWSSATAEGVTVVRETVRGEGRGIERSVGPRGNIFTSPLSFRSLFRLYGVVAGLTTVPPLSSSIPHVPHPRIEVPLHSKWKSIDRLAL